MAASTITDDAVKAQWKKQNDAHQKAYETVVLIAQQLGCTIDAQGNLIPGDKSAVQQEKIDIDIKMLSDNIYKAINIALAQHQKAVPSHDEIFKCVTEQWNGKGA